MICSLCGTAPDPKNPMDAGGLTWTTSVESGDAKVYCTACAREHLRSIEGKLDSPDWWD